MTRPDTRTGPIAWMARNPVAANLLMFVILVGGLVGAFQVKQEIFPEFDLDMVTISVPYPGATPDDVEQGIVRPIEEAVRGVDGVKRVSSTSGEGSGMVSVELLLDAEPNKVLGDVENAVNRITVFPLEAEEPVVSLATRRSTVISLVVAAELELAPLHEVAERARMALLAHPEITQVELQGVPPLELAIEIPRERLESLGLTLDEVARVVRAGSLELPGGGVKTAQGEVLVRVADRALSAEDFAAIPLRTTADGASLLLGDVAEIRDGYADTDQESYYNGKRAVRIVAYRVGKETPSAVAKAVHAYRDELEAELPPHVQVATWDDDSEKLTDRIALLLKNGAIGLVLVVTILTLLLRLRLAFWVSLGLPISFMGGFLLMPGADLSVNMITLFAFIVTLGMVVDDAIVVGENIYNRMQEGLAPIDAAIVGAREMAMPVTFAILTSVAAFMPLFFVPGTMGKVFSFFPFVVVAVLGFSLIESFFVLPAHLGHSHQGNGNAIARRIDSLSTRAGGALERFTAERYRPFLQAVMRRRYLSISVGVAVFFVSVGMVASGLVPFNFFPKLEGDVVKVEARLPYGAPMEDTLVAQRALEQAAVAALNRLGGPEHSRGLYTLVGEGPAQRYGPTEYGSHLVTIEQALVPSDQRDFTSGEFSSLWAQLTPSLPMTDAIIFESSSGPGAGAAVDVQLSHADTAVLERAAAELAEALADYSELYNVVNGFAAGKPRLDYDPLPRAESLGITPQELGRQLRSAFFGAEAIRELRGRNELKVMVRLPEHQRESEHDLEALRIRTPRGGFVPLGAVADIERNRAPTSILREDGRRIVNVSAELTAQVKSSRAVRTDLEESVLPELARRHPGLEAQFVGQQRSQQEAFGSLGKNYLVALFVIYALLAIPFRSYIQPAIIMSAIPFGFVGAVLGHLLLGYPLSLISLFGIIALSGVVVNDSLVLIDAVNKKRAEGVSAFEAATFGGVRRLRPIILTSLTTFFGLAPMIFETSVQARFLVPMAISLGFGVLFATLIILLLVPALYLVVEDLRGVPVDRPAGGGLPLSGKPA
jgi:multidrug efflux pump subunit AcrB